MFRFIEAKNGFDSSIFQTCTINNNEHTFSSLMTRILFLCANKLVSYHGFKRLLFGKIFFYKKSRTLYIYFQFHLISFNIIIYCPYRIRSFLETLRHNHTHGKSSCRTISSDYLSFKGYATLNINGVPIYVYFFCIALIPTLSLLLFREQRNLYWNFNEYNWPLQVIWLKYIEIL